MPSLRLIVACGQIPFQQTANDQLADSLAETCRKMGHRVTRLRLPLPQKVDDLPTHFSAYRLLHLKAGDAGERLIALDLAAACLRHNDKILWIGQPLGGLDPQVDADLSTTTLATLSRAARLFAAEAKLRWAISPQAAGSMEKLAELSCRVLPPNGFDADCTAPSDRPRERTAPAQTVARLLGESCVF